MKQITSLTGAALLIAAIGLVTFAPATRAGGRGIGGGSFARTMEGGSFDRGMGSINRSSGSFAGAQTSLNRGHAVMTRGRGADDLANHNANDDRGRHRGQNAGNRRADDPANHDANDDRGRHRGRNAANRGADDAANHDADENR